MFNQDDLVSSFPRIAHRAARYKTHVMLHIFGGASLMLTTDIRLLTADIDRLVFTGSYGSYNERMLKKVLEPLVRASRKAKTMGIDPVASINPGFYNRPLAHDVFRPYGTYVSTKGYGLSVWVAPPKMDLAAKATSNREKDIHDCAKICWMLGINSPTKVYKLVEHYRELTPQLVRAAGYNRTLYPSEKFGKIFEALQGLKRGRPRSERPKLKPSIPKFVHVVA